MVQTVQPVAPGLEPVVRVVQDAAHRLQVPGGVPQA